MDLPCVSVVEGWRFDVSSISFLRRKELNTDLADLDATIKESHYRKQILIIEKPFKTYLGMYIITWISYLASYSW